MQQKNKYFCKSVCLIILLFSSTLLQAQNEPYTGGAGSGDMSLNAFTFSCTNFRFTGGFGSGDSSLSSANNSCNIFRFNGGIGSGDSSLNAALGVCNISQYYGGFGSGDSSSATSLLTCNINRFWGGYGRGDSSISTSLLDCNTFRFHGDSAGGNALATFIRIRNFLGNDTSAVIVCSSETANLFTLYDSTGLIFNWNTLTPNAAGLGTYQLVALTKSGCTDTANATIYQDVIKWTGAISNNWHDAANWNTGKIPNERSHVIIPGGTLNPCQISIADAKAASVQAKSSGSFSIVNNRVLLLSGNCSSLPPGL